MAAGALSDDQVWGAPAAPAAAGGIPAMIAAEAQSQGVDPNLAMGIWHAEGRGDITARSPKGAIGPMQLMPGTARDLGVDPMDLAQNIRGGVSYLGQQLKTFKDPRLAAAAYNAGPGAVMAHGGVPPYPETEAYVQRATGAAPAGGDVQGAEPRLSDDEAWGAPVAPAPAPGALSDDAAWQAPPATIKVVNGQIVFGDTNAPVSAHQASTVRTLVQGGIIDGKGDPGTVGSPFVQRSATDQFKPGQYYIDAKSGHLVQTPGGPKADGGFASGLGAGLGDIPNSIFKLLPGQGNSDVGNAMEANRLVYDANTRGDMGAGAGRFTGQVLGSIPLMAGGEAALGGLATKAPAAMQPLLEFLAGKGGSGIITRGASRFARGAQEGAGAALTTSAASDDPLAVQMGEGALAGGVLRNAAPPLIGHLKNLLSKGGDDTVAPQAMDYVTRLLAADKATPESLAAADPNLTLAEASGDSAKGGLSALGKRQGETGNVLSDLIGQRKTGRGDRVLSAVSDAMGISPEAAQGSLDAVVKQGQAEAAPLYDEAYAKGPVWSEKLGQLSRTPAGQAAMKYARTLMGNEMKDPEALGMTFLENPEQWASYAPPAAEAEAAPVGFAGGPRGPARAPSRGPSLMQFLAGRGGVEDQGGELSAMGADAWHVGKPFQPKFTGWINPEDAAQYAWEQGYFPRAEAPPSVNELYDAIGQEMRGKALYAREADQGAANRFNAANAAEERSYRGGDPMDVPSPEQYVGRPQPTSEPALQHVPNAQTVDYVKRGFDQQLAPYNSGKLEPDDISRSINNVRAQWLAEAKGLNPAYGAALDRAGDYLSVKDAFGRASSLVFNNRVGPTQFAKALNELTPPQLMGLRAGAANKILNDVLAAKADPTLTLNTLQTPMLQRKLRMMLGDKATRQLSDALMAESKMKGFEDYYGPKANSGTATFGAAMAEQDKQPFLKRLGMATVRNLHRGPIRGPLAGFGQAMEPVMAGLQTPGMPVPVRDAAGQHLAGPAADFAQLMAAAGPQPKASAVRGMIGSAGRTAANLAAIRAIEAARVTR